MDPEEQLIDGDANTPSTQNLYAVSETQAIGVPTEQVLHRPFSVFRSGVFPVL